MTSLDADLAMLREWAEEFSGLREVVPRVEAELARLRHERDELYEANWPWEWVIATREKEQRQAAERELVHLRKERNEYKQAAGAEADLFDTSQMQVRQERESRQTAERELARLEEGLRHTADELASRRGMIDRLVAADKFRALLADTEDGAT